MKFRMYVDEVGNPDLKASADNPNHRYLSLTGVILELDYVASTLFPAFESLKTRYLDTHPDEPVIFHRKDILNAKGAFIRLRDPSVRSRFDNDLLELLRSLEYTVITAIIDKLEHVERYRRWQYDPYHYCLLILVERYVLWLRSQGAVGDVMAESRGGKEDHRLKQSFERVYKSGTDYMSPADFSRYLTSCQLKVKPKSANVAGLQLADLVAHPSFRSSLARREGEPLPNNFGGRVAAILERTKYDRRATEKDALRAIDRYGRKWLP